MLKSIDLFAGAGGLSEGLKRAGFQSLYSNEISMRYAQTYQYRVQEAFNNVTLPDENVYRDAILAALCAAEK